jgi:hypothetical protein
MAYALISSGWQEKKRRPWKPLDRSARDGAHVRDDIAAERAARAEAVVFGDYKIAKEARNT